MIQESKKLGDRTMAELVELRVTLLKNINANPDHSGIERVELEDVEGWIELRRREKERRESVPTFDDIGR